MIRPKVMETMGLERRDDRFRRAIDDLVSRGVPILVIYGRGGFAADLQSELDRGLGRVLEDADPRTKVLSLPLQLEGYPSLEWQDAVIGEVTTWLQSLVDLHARPA